MAMLTIQTDSIPPALPPFAFVFKLNPLPAGKTPFLVPVINNPDFDILAGSPPGIVQFAEGNIGIASTIIGASMIPVTSVIDNLKSSTNNIINDVKDAANQAKDAANKAKDAASNAANQAKDAANQAKDAANKAKNTAEQAKDVVNDLNDNETYKSPKKIPTQNNIASNLQTSVKNSLETQFVNMPNAGLLPSLPNIANPMDSIDISLDDFKIPEIDTSALLPSASDLINNASPSDSGLASFEKMTIKSFLETYKPIMEAVLVLIDMLADAEDAVARFLGTSIKIPIINIWVGIPSKNPYYTDGALNYGDSNSMNKDYILNENAKALNGVLNTFKETADIFGGIPGDSLVDIKDYEDTQQSYYIGYFDEDGENVLPPSWVLNSNKWFGEKWKLTENNQQPEQLSDDQNIGILQLKNNYDKKLKILDIEKNKLESYYSYQENTYQQNTENRTNTTNGKEQALNMMQDVIDEVNKGVEQTVYSEWFTKHIVSQFKTLYNEPFISTAEPVTDKKGKPKEPYVSFPTINIDGQKVEITVVESENQLIRKKVKENKKKREKIVGLNTTTNNNGETIISAEKSEDTKILYWSHKKESSTDQQTIKQTKIPDDVKRFYFAHDFEIVLDYEIRDIKTQKVISTEREIIPQSIDFEKNYKFRLIRVINKPTIKDLELFKKKFTKKSDALSYLKNNFDKNYDSKTGTVYAENNNIPEQYDKVTNGNNSHSAKVINKNNKLFEGEIEQGVDPRFNGFRILKYKKINNKDILVNTFNIIQSTEDESLVIELNKSDETIKDEIVKDDILSKLKASNESKESPNYYYKLEQYKYQVFWLVEAIKLNKDGTFIINNELYDNNAGEDGIKNDNTREWYGLLDKFTAIFVIVTRLIPKIARKFIPLIVKIIQILTNPYALADLVFLIITEKISQLFGMFSTKFDDKSTKDKASMVDDKLAGAASKFHYKSTTMKSPINVADGKKYVEIFGFFIGMASINGELKLYYTKKQYEEETKDLPEHALINFILKLIKLPFDIIEKIIKFLMDLIKKLVNPFTLLQTLIDFISFKWLIDILTAAIGVIAGFLIGNFEMYDKILQNKNSKDMNNELLASLQGNNSSSNLVKVNVYHVFKNGKYVKEEIEEEPLNDKDIKALSYFPPQGVNMTDDLKSILNEKNPGNKEGPNNPPFSNPVSCGINDIPLNTFIPSPFICKSPDFNMCDLNQLYTKPLEQIFSQLNFIQGIVQGLIALPFAALGLAPHIPIPEVNFTKHIKEKIDSINDNIEQNSVPTENTDLLKKSEINLKDFENKPSDLPDVKKLATKNSNAISDAINASKGLDLI